MAEVYEPGALVPMMNGGYGSGPKSQQTAWIIAPDGTMTRYSSSDPAALAPYMTPIYPRGRATRKQRDGLDELCG
jgi:hypothetical protein